MKSNRKITLMPVLVYTFALHTSHTALTLGNLHVFTEGGICRVKTGTNN